MKKEIQLPTGRAEINVNSTGSSVTIDGFKATLMQLRILSRRGNMKPNAICAEVGITRGSHDVVLQHLRDANTDDFSDDVRPTLDQLTETANKHELLYPLSVIGLEVLAAEMRKKQVPTSSLPRQLP